MKGYDDFCKHLGIKKGYIDNEANDMHEAVVKEISDNLAKGCLYED